MLRENDDKSTPLISVIMNCYNSATYLRQAIDSVYSQSYKNFEIIFWDNASTDDSAEIAKSYDFKIKYYRGSETIPLGAARNKAIEKASGELIAFLDCDDLWMPLKLEKQVPLFQDSEVDLVFCDSLFFNDSGYEKRLFSKTRFYTGHCFSKLLSNYFLSMETIVIRRSALDRLSYWFDERFNMIEEADLFRRIAMTGKLATVNEVLAKWRIHSGSWTWQKTELFWKETKLMLEAYEEKDPEFSVKYKEEIRILNSGLAREEAIHLLLIGEARKARKKIMEDNSVFKGKIILLLTFFPSRLLKFVFKLLGKAS
ncbi:glycosyltransferase-like protein, family 2 [Leptospira inadai serovar Lyme str. 10]|uniref:Glycosyltransferase-like protein, family 2 n=2 Tax=Leptospira inadai serovar Lyme TaxID=293084 RepID=V6HBB0_9LEPT|nr:glycosyltransferase [Leptospira inadai]EQA36682.1 glycosyltransferase-like protein, family 2 [Leptospira inadai serovar Lyme str. 10]PNV75829.1 glycosyl transferase family 2 [Leptospira inadai serovar Lyme]